MSTEDTRTEEEQIEGLDSGADKAWGDYPIDTVLIRNENRTVYDVLRRIEKGSFVMDPDFQREFIWPVDKQSKLIESVMMRIPLPVFYLAEDDEGRMVVVDGLQRLSTFQQFVNGTLKLRLPDQAELNKKHFKDLTPKLQNRVEDCNLILYVIDAKVPERARLDIFERVNAGIPLTRQQMRNCLYSGPATKFLKEQAATELFLAATGNSLKTTTMRDREFVNRFCAFQLLAPEDYKGEMDDFLAEALKKMNGFSEAEFALLAEQLQQGLENNLALFGPHAFRKHTPGQENRSVLNASLWDVASTYLSSFTGAQVEEHREELLDGFYKLLEDPGFVQSISYSPNSVKQVQYRFDAFFDMLHEVFRD